MNKGNFFFISVMLLHLACLTLACNDDQPTGGAVTYRCDCPLQKQVSGGHGTSVDSTATGYGIEGGVEIDVPLVKKLVEGNIGLSGNLHHEKANIEKAYWQILDGNPQITQYANLYWATACALYEIACEDETLEEVERQQELRQIIREYDSRLGEIIGLSEAKNEADLSPKATPIRSTTPRTKPVVEVSRAELPNTTASKYILSRHPTDIAVLQTGDSSYEDLSNTFAGWLRNHTYRVNTAFFHPDFIGHFRSQLKMGDGSVFDKINTGSLTNCVCLFDQLTQLEESTLAGEAFITASLSGKITLFDLRGHNHQNFSIEVRGAGITISRAMESIEEKLNTEFAALEPNFSLCR